MARNENRDGIPAVARRRTGRYANDPVSLGLRKLWQNVEQENVPMEMLDLLDAIDAASRDDAAAVAVPPTNLVSDQT